jgi:hypothetical protein
MSIQIIVFSWEVAWPAGGLLPACPPLRGAIGVQLVQLIQDWLPLLLVKVSPHPSAKTTGRISQLTIE